MIFCYVDVIFDIRYFDKFFVIRNVVVKVLDELYDLEVSVKKILVKDWELDVKFFIFFKKWL